MTPEQLGLLTLAALGAGAVDAIGGGGGLVTVPALLAAGLPPHAAIGTNKGQSMFGSLAAIVRYARAGLVDGRAARWTVPLSALGSAAGAALVLGIPPAVLRLVVLVLLVIVAGFFVAWRPGGAQAPTPGRRAARAIGASIALLVGAYDGFFGPGTGTFAIAAYMALMGLAPTRATADAKVLNFASNLAAACVFASHGVILWSVALPMAAAQLLGGFLGAHLAVRRGAGLIRAVVLIVVLALTIKIVLDIRHPF